MHHRELTWPLVGGKPTGMRVVISSFTRALAQLGDPAILRIIGKSLAVTLALFVTLGWIGSITLDALFARFGMANEEGLEMLVGVLLAVIAAWLLFRVVAIAVLQFFADEIVLKVEQKCYPQEAATACKLPLRQDVSNSVKGAARAILVNLAALPFAIILLFTGIGTAALFWLVNALLLGRELNDMAWLRHRQSVDDLPPTGPMQRFALGGIVAGLMMVPFINFLAPVLGAAAATHLVLSQKRTGDL